MKKKLTIISVLVICATIVTSGTLAYFTAEDRARNVITSGGVNIELVETTKKGDGTEVEFPKEGLTGIMPGTSASKIVSVKNIGDEAWIRVKVDTTILDSQGNELPQTIGDTSVVSYEVSSTDWFSSNGYYYYKDSVQMNESTNILFDEVRFAKEMGNEYQNCRIEIDIDAQAVQTANNPIPAGGDVSDIPGWPAE